MEIELRALAVTATGLSPLRVNWGEAGSVDRAPYVVLHLIGMTDGRHMQGPNRLFRSRVQIDCYAPDFAGAAALRAAVISALDGYRDGILRGVFFDGARQTRESGANAGEAVYRASLDFLVNWRKSDG